jgi:hypothetical protein
VAVAVAVCFEAKGFAVVFPFTAESAPLVNWDRATVSVSTEGPLARGLHPPIAILGFRGRVIDKTARGRMHSSERYGILV